ncbi:hypothetical protein BHM03_00055393 [Ensete ventricosum]|nr:hypothetical protein BHM03_00055393 [Ensete ventricosum]
MVAHEHGWHLQGVVPMGAAPPSGMVPTHKGDSCRHSARRSYRPRGSDAYRKVGRSWVRRPLDEGKIGGLGYPFEKRMIMPLKI